MHPADNVAIEYGKLARERDDLQKKIDAVQPHVDRKAQIEAQLEELRGQMSEAIASPEAFAAKAKAAKV